MAECVCSCACLRACVCIMWGRACTRACACARVRPRSSYVTRSCVRVCAYVHAHLSTSFSFPLPLISLILSLHLLLRECVCVCSYLLLQQLLGGGHEEGEQFLIHHLRAIPEINRIKQESSQKKDLEGKIREWV
jgi:hypothetical protein